MDFEQKVLINDNALIVFNRIVVHDRIQYIINNQ